MQDVRTFGDAGHHLATKRQEQGGRDADHGPSNVTGTTSPIATAL